MINGKSLDLPMQIGNYYWSTEGVLESNHLSTSQITLHPTPFPLLPNATFPLHPTSYTLTSISPVFREVTMVMLAASPTNTSFLCSPQAKKLTSLITHSTGEGLNSSNPSASRPYCSTSSISWRNCIFATESNSKSPIAAVSGSNTIWPSR